MKLMNVDFKKFMSVVDKCSGSVYMITEEGDKINLKSKLSQLIGVFKIIECGEISIDNLICSNQEDTSRIFRFLLYGEV